MPARTLAPYRYRISPRERPAVPLVKPFQSKLGHVMYLCNSTRCDILYAVHQLARCMCKPAPDLMLELDHLIAYLARTRTLGLTYSRESRPT